MYSWKVNFEVAIDMISYVKNNELPKEVQEGYCRSIVHKSYYGCFHLVLEKNAFYNLSTNSGGANSHADAIEQIDQYTQIERIKRRTIINRLLQLKDYRRDADYVSNKTFKVERAEGINRLAVKTFEELSEF